MRINGGKISAWIKVLSVVLAISTIAMICPQKIQARSLPETVNPQMAELGRRSLSMALGIVNPAMSSILSTVETEADSNPDKLNNTAYLTDDLPQISSSTSYKDNGLDIDALIAAAPPSPARGITLLTRCNTWDVSPQDHDEMVQCVEEDSAYEEGWYGASIVDAIDQTGNIHGNDDHYISFYHCFFYVDTPGLWSFATNSDDASELEIDRKDVNGAEADGTILGWYGSHRADATDNWKEDHSLSIDLPAGWHRFIYRHEDMEGASSAHVAFKKPGYDCRLFSTDFLILIPVNLNEGLLLTAGANT
ncbi:MAG: hypothetical protein JXA46_16355 [Dehalococcoidales bacterium]|nr:hypothetical protein [Dehalococcoidales bacterium]